MKILTLPVIFLTLSGCALQQANTEISSEPAEISAVPECVGSTDIPAAFADNFEAVTDAALLTDSLGEPTKGKLCQGEVYESKPNADIVIYRAWNSTNPGSKLGSWWALYEPAGAVADYREDYEICYQWSPLDKMVRCTLKAGTKVVVGNGQSAFCSAYLTYPVSESQQVYIQDAANAVENCTTFTAEFSWK